MSQFFQILGAQSAVDDTVVTAHRDRHAVADDNSVAIIDYRNLGDLAKGENKPLRRIYDSGETIDAHAAANDWRQQPVFNRHGNSKIDIGILHNRIAIERGVYPRNLDRRLH